MKRREFVEKAGIGAAALVALTTGAEKVTRAEAGGQHDHGPISGPLATATVSFGAWAHGTDRFPNKVASAGLPNNVHALIPNEVKIKAGGTVNFIISGFHLVVIYGDGTAPGDINTSLTIAPTTQPAPPLIDDPRNRVYRGIDPTVLPLLRGPQQQGPVGPPFQPAVQDRTEVVHFPEPGTFLVICGVLPHFNDGMYGYVKVNA
jgi:plastocyanin